VAVCHKPSLASSIMLAVKHKVDSNPLESIRRLDALGLAMVLKAFVVHDLGQLQLNSISPKCVAIELVQSHCINIVARNLNPIFEIECLVK
jgi:hypothetical protein